MVRFAFKLLPLSWRALCFPSTCSYIAEFWLTFHYSFSSIFKEFIFLARNKYFMFIHHDCSQQKPPPSHPLLPQYKRQYSPLTLDIVETMITTSIVYSCRLLYNLE